MLPSTATRTNARGLRGTAAWTRAASTSRRSATRSSARTGRRLRSAMGALLDHVRAYYEALNRGDSDEVASYFTDDATHYYTRLGPHRGAKTIGDHTKLAVDHIEGQWFFENGIDDGEQAVIEWTMTWRDPKS